MLLDAILVATTAVVGVQVYDAVRIKRVRAWVILNAALGGASIPGATVSISFPGGTTGVVGSQMETNATSISSTEPAFCELAPDPRSGQAFFNSNGAVAAFRIDERSASHLTIEADLEYRYNNDNAPTAVANALVGATAGQFYFRGMDGLALAATQWPADLGPSI